MSPKRIGILLKKDLIHGPKNFIFIYAVVMPLAISLVLTLVFGSLFSEKPKLGVFDEGDSILTTSVMEQETVDGKGYDSASALRKAVETGAMDMGIIVPAGFDDTVRSGEATAITAYTWGESLAKNRDILENTITGLARDLAGQEVPIEIATSELGDGESIPWRDRLLPFIVLMAVLFGGTMVPATSLVDEKQKLTLKALVITPATLGDVFLTKALIGMALSTLIGVLVLVLNQAFGSQPLMLVMVLALGATLAAGFGLFLGAMVKDITSLFATIKAVGILLYAPAIVYMFPQIPQWIGRLFPTYYLVGPIFKITQQNGGWSDIATDVFVLVGLIVAMTCVVGVMVRKARTREV
jgi:ABC-2 type transport system permease protein